MSGASRIIQWWHGPDGFLSEGIVVHDLTNSPIQMAYIDWAYGVRQWEGIQTTGYCVYNLRSDYDGVMLLEERVMGPVYGRTFIFCMGDNNLRP